MAKRKTTEEKEAAKFLERERAEYERRMKLANQNEAAVIAAPEDSETDAESDETEETSETDPEEDSNLETSENET